MVTTEGKDRRVAFAASFIDNFDEMSPPPIGDRRMLNHDDPMLNDTSQDDDPPTRLLTGDPYAMDCKKVTVGLMKLTDTSNEVEYAISNTECDTDYVVHSI